ncbi:Glycoside hydrolase family 76 protein [Mycena indigotica]|uniref:Glycoside hydrolase family 76 protein n=1 Tax=Mycena indigotica TaxID=2126181 RepID=A0A8H6VQN7_9AGAR|nr:Glycoside hydrolase family 76 protein [Mycena indigotica]KAF7290159.1 Glycoside hydrolase family 76 protein [Mycena indigotica]
MLPFPLPLPLLFAAVVGQVAAQPPGSSWRKPNITTPLQDRISLAQGAISQAVSQLDSSTSMFPNPGSTYKETGALYSLLAEFDQLTNRSQYAANLAQYYASAQTVLDNAKSQNFSGFYVLNDGLNYGHGAIVAYKTYNVSVFLQYAVQSWWAAVPYTMTQAEVDAGKMPSKNFTLGASCQGATLAGGSFWNKDGQNPSVYVIATGNFLILSALLAEATSDPAYLAAAAQSMTFIHSHLYNAQGLIENDVSARAGDNCAVGIPDLLPYNSGLVMEGLAILYSITKNATYSTMLDQLVSVSFATNAWTDSTGIIQVGSAKTADASIPRGLVAAYVRNATSPSVRLSIASYLAVQYNAVADLAKQPGGDIYGGFWQGPPGLTFDPASQTTAIQALISSLAVTDSGPVSPSGTSSGPSPPTNSAAPAPNSKSESSIGAIVGGVVSGILVLGALAIVLICRIRMLRRRQLPLALLEPHYAAVNMSEVSPGLPSRPSYSSPARPSETSGPVPAGYNPKRPQNLAAVVPVRRAPSLSPSSESWAVPPPTVISSRTRSSSDFLPSDSQETSSGRGPGVERQPTTEELVRMLVSRMNGGSVGTGTGMTGLYEEPLPEYRTA